MNKTQQDPAQRSGDGADNGRSLDAFANRALRLAQEAAKAGSYGVGALLMDLDGNILYEKTNRVVRNSRIYDPTAHSERQIVDWYLANKEKENLPEPAECILITTLDPCLMCTGALAQAGFGTVIVIALDPHAGINSRGNYECTALAGTACRNYVTKHFAYPLITGARHREAFGADLSRLKLFTDDTITTETYLACGDAFTLNLSELHKELFARDNREDNVLNPAELDLDHPIRRYLKETFGPDCFGCTWNPGESAEVITDYMNKNHPGFDGAACFDLFGNLLCIAEDDPELSSRSAIMKLIRKYAAARAAEPIGNYDIRDYLANPRFAYFMYMTCPDLSAVTIMEIGALGSAFGNHSPHPILYMNGAQKEPAVALLIQHLPPLYNEQLDLRFERIV